MANVFAHGGKVEGPSDAEIKELNAKIGRLTVENVFVSRAQAMSPTEKRQMIRNGHPELSISQQCRLVKLSRSAFYYDVTQGQLA